MEPSLQDLRAQYTGLNDAALLQLAAERDTLTPAAIAAVEQELQQRGLAMPSVPQETESIESDPETWVTVERFRDLSAGIVARAALEAAAIPCLLRDENTVRMDWQISNLIGGMRLQVLARGERSARELLQQFPAAATQTEPVDALEPEERCPLCGSADIHRVERGFALRLAALFLTTIPLPRGKRVWQCSACGKATADADM